jgi:hypothetical protein
MAIRPFTHERGPRATARPDAMRYTIRRGRANGHGSTTNTANVPGGNDS